MEGGGDREMRDFEANESEEREMWCEDCDSTLPDEVEIPTEIYEQLLNHVVTNEANIFPFDIGNRSPSDIKPEEIKDIIVITLL
jgi:hypothetical protein